jgi:hypothetical protein
MTHPEHSQSDTDQLDQALDALMRGDHSGLDALPPEMAATVSRLIWLQQEGADVVETMPPDADASERLIARGPASARPAQVSIPGAITTTPVSAPMSRRTRRATGIEREPPAGGKDVTPIRRREWHGVNALLRVAAIVLVLALAGGSIYGIVTMREESDFGSTGTEGLYPQQLQPGRCNVEAIDREYVLEILRDIDVDRDEVLRRATLLRPAELSNGEVATFVQLFVEWQSCRRFGATYQAMAMQAPYFTREDFYGETTLDFRGPVETAYSDATLNEMLDRREELDTTSRLYWENAGHYPSPSETLILGGEKFATDDGHFIAIRALTWDMDTGEWLISNTVVVFRLIDNEYRIFDIQSTPIGTPPYL